MVVYVTRNLRVDCDEHNFTLEQKHVGEKNGAAVTTWRGAGYYPNLRQALEAAVRKSFAEPGNANIREVVEKLENASRRIEAVVCELAAVCERNRLPELGVESTLQSPAADVEGVFDPPVPGVPVECPF